MGLLFFDLDKNNFEFLFIFSILKNFIKVSIFSEKITPPYYTLYSNAQHVLRPESKPCVTSPLEMVFIPAKITNRTDVQHLPL